MQGKKNIELDISYGSGVIVFSSTCYLKSSATGPNTTSYRCNCHFCLCFRTHLFVLALFLSKTSDGASTIGTLGSLCSRFERGPCSVSRVASLIVFLTFLAAGVDKAIAGFPQHPRGWGFRIPYPRERPYCYVRETWMQIGFSC